MNSPVLLVEDDENDVFFMTEAFKKAGLAQRLQIAMDGRRAIEYLKGTGPYGDRTRFPLPCLVLLDLKLPFVMGLDVLRTIRQELHLLTVVVVLSASREPIDVAEAYRLGANAYLVKPSDMGRLQEMVKAIELFWLNHNTGV
jgi:CheY-like chemotaxis protein